MVHLVCNRSTHYKLLDIRTFRLQSNIHIYIHTHDFTFMQGLSLSNGKCIVTFCHFVFDNQVFLHITAACCKCYLLQLEGPLYKMSSRSVLYSNQNRPNIQQSQNFCVAFIDSHY